MKRLLTAKPFVNDQNHFNWPVNIAEIYPEAYVKNNNAYMLTICLGGYSPYKKAWQYAVDNNNWVMSEQEIISLKFGAGQHIIKSRILLANGETGPETIIKVIFH